jgi:hypothetical protein
LLPKKPAQAGFVAAPAASGRGFNRLPLGVATWPPLRSVLSDDTMPAVTSHRRVFHLPLPCGEGGRGLGSLRLLLAGGCGNHFVLKRTLFSWSHDIHTPAGQLGRQARVLPLLADGE